MLATLLLSKGTPMLLAGDEFGNSQQGNNNAYAQDNEIGWQDWKGLESDPDFLKQVQELIRLRRFMPHLASEVYLHGRTKNDAGWHNVEWLNPGFSLPTMSPECDWKLVFHSTEAPPLQPGLQTWNLASRSIVCAKYIIG